MSNKKIFCNVPWTNTHIYWDGSYGSCCSESRKIYPQEQSKKYNVQNISIADWYASEPMRDLRKQMLSNEPIGSCSSCYFEERNGYESRRIKENFKSVVFTQQAFERSYQQSPWYNQFESGDHELPIDWHVDLGNECNLACKMCHPGASSRFAQHLRTWGLLDHDLPANWTNNDSSWTRFIDDLKSIPKLNRVHFMGGEPMLSKRFEQFVDTMLEHNPNLSVSFVSNGTILKQSVIDKLKKFRSCDIEISLESIHSNNHYIRQGSDTEQVLSNIKNLAQQQTDSFHIVLRSVPQLLNINNYNEYIMWAYTQGLPIQGIPLIVPNYLSIVVLPKNIKDRLIIKYQQLADFFKQQLANKPTSIVVGRNAGNLEQLFLKESESMIRILNLPEPTNIESLRQELITWLMRWDREYKLDARIVYPEYAEFLEKYEYSI